MTQMVSTLINERWELLLPEHRAARPEWPHWEKERLAMMALNIAPGDVVVDVGAEEGDMAALYASWGAGVVLVEPNPRVWPNIKAIWDANGLLPPLGHWVGFAGAGQRTGAPDWPPHGQGGDWPGCANGEVIGDHGFLNLWERDDVPVARLDALVAGCDHVTIDVEGSELAVLEGASGLLSSTARRPMVWASVHPLFMREHYGAKPAALHAFMRSFGYHGHLIAAAHEEHWLFIPGSRP